MKNKLKLLLLIVFIITFLFIVYINGIQQKDRQEKSDSITITIGDNALNIVISNEEDINQIKSILENLNFINRKEISAEIVYYTINLNNTDKYGVKRHCGEMVLNSKYQFKISNQELETIENIIKKYNKEFEYLIQNY